MNNLNLIASNHFFWFTQSAKELQEMLRYSFDLSPEGGEKFRLAQERFDLARSRAQREFESFSIAYTDTTDRELNEETGEDL